MMYNMPMQRNRLTILSAAVLLLSGCAGSAAQNTEAVNTPVPEVSQAAPDASAAERYHTLMKNNAVTDNYTAGVQRTYDMRYEDGSISVYDLDGVLEQNGDVLHITQHINADGIQSETEGWYDGKRMYMTYNTVDFYEDMNLSSAKDVMLVKTEPYEVTDDMLEGIVSEEQNGSTVFTLTLTPEAAQSLFDSRYDIYGLKEYEQYAVTSGTLIQKFDADGILTDDDSEFKAEVTVDGIRVDVTAATSAGYMNIGSTETAITDAQKEKFETFVYYEDIDTNAISEADITSDYPEDTPEATFRKRLVNRLNYKLQEDGTYLAEFNETESYRVDFEHSLFTYSNRASRYVYNWKGDQGGFGDSCSVDFATGVHSDACQDSAVEQIEAVRKYFAMELYYCGLSLEDLREGTQKK